MMKRNFLVRASLLAATLLVVFPLAVQTATETAMKIKIYLTAVDEQTGIGCPTPPAVDPAMVRGDQDVGSTAYELGSPWTTFSGLLATIYTNGDSCNSTSNVCLGVKLVHSDKTISLDTRGTLGPRKVEIDFRNPCATSLCGFQNKPLEFDSIIRMPVLLSVFLDTPFTGMGVCSSTACPEAQPATLRLWFDDPKGDPQQTWRVDWGYLRVLRMSANTWYVIANGCDGSRVARLYKLHNNRRQLSVSLQGLYLMPLFLSAVPAK